MRSPSGQATGQFPGMGGARLAGGSPRYQLYPTRDGKLVACAALEQKFWEAFTAAIGLAPEFVDDRRDPAANQAAVAAIIAGRTAEEWRPVLASGRLLRHHHGDAGRGAARSAFRCSAGCSRTASQAVGRDHAGAAGADRSAIFGPIRAWSKRCRSSTVDEREIDAEHQHREEEQEPEHLRVDEFAHVLPDEHANKGDHHRQE